MSDQEREPKIFSYPNRPDLKTTTAADLAKQSDESGPKFSYPNRQQSAVYKKPLPDVLQTDGITVIAHNTTGLDLLARRKHLAGAALPGLKAEGFLVAEDRNLESSSLKDILLRDVRVRGWNLQRSEISGRVEGSDCRAWDLRSARTIGLSFTRCRIDGMRGAPRGSLINCTGIPESYADEG